MHRVLSGEFIHRDPHSECGSLPRLSNRTANMLNNNDLYHARCSFLVSPERFSSAVLWKTRISFIALAVLAEGGIYSTGLVEVAARSLNS